MIRLPADVSAYLFDLDGVLTKTASVHAQAWKQVFDDELRERDGDRFRPFDIRHDYDEYVDGKPRQDGVRSFMASRGIHLAPAEVQHIADCKNALVLQLIAEGKVEAYEGSVRFVRAAREAGKRTAVVSSSANCQAVLEAIGIADEFEVRIDGHTIEDEGIPGKPAPDSYLAAAARLGVRPALAAVFEDAIAGVQAGRAGHFGVVVGVDRVDHGAELSANGATIVVQDLDELLGTAGPGTP